MIYSHALQDKAKRHAEYLQQQDLRRFGKRMAFKYLREPSPGLIQTVERHRTTTANEKSPLQFGLITVTSLDEVPWDLLRTVQINGHDATIVDVQGADIELMLTDPPDSLPPPYNLTQIITTSDPQQVSDELSQYWNQFWQRDTPDQQNHIHEWPQFQQILELIPQHETISITMTNLQDWLTAIKAVKSTTARGSCGWSADELKSLPDICIRDLMFVMHNNYGDGFPKWQMDSRVLPVSKQQGAISPKSTRPITVLPLIYRVWSRVLARKILDVWGSRLPREITGFVPGRQASDQVYRLQLQFEAAAHGFSSHQWGGITLDIVKCFNAVPVAPLREICIRLGIPASFVNRWISSLSRSTRHWQVNGQLFPVPEATTGVPEGDSLSVTAMLAINQCWTAMVKQPNIWLHAYADNWSYNTNDPTRHYDTLQRLLRFAQSLSLTIDWHKTWSWCTDILHKRALQAAASQLLPDQNSLQHVNHARELGYIMHYRLAPFRGTHKERHEAALKRLRKLQHADYSLEDKSHMAISSALAKALFGVHMYQCGERYFTQLRSATARALVGDHHNVQSYVACSCLTRRNCDPEFHTIVQALKCARHFLLWASPEEFSLFMQLAVQTNIRAAHVIGPAMAFTAYLSKIGWTLNKQGDLFTTFGATFNLCNSNLEDILTAAEEDWMRNVVLSISNRRGMTSIPLPSRRRTCAALAKLPKSSQPIVAIEMTAGFMTNYQKHQFAQDQTENCELCGDLDSVPHRILHRAATEVVRAPHQAAINFLHEYDDIHTLLPLAYADPEVDFCKLLLHTMPWPEVFHPTHYLPEFIFTDGSCKHPEAVETRWASFAVVYPHMDLTQLAITHQTDAHWLLHHAFTTAAVGHVQGRQNVPRAELTASDVAQEMRTNAILVTDSQYVIDSHELIKATPEIRMLHKKTNFDLLRKLHKLFWEDRYHLPVCKVKAHQALNIGVPDFQLRQGNAVADLAANLAHVNLHQPLTQQLDELRIHQTFMDEHLHLQLVLRSDLSFMRSRLLKEDPVCMDPDEKINQLIQWSVQPFRIFRIPLELHYIVHASRWGTSYTATLVEWISTLEWPLELDNARPPIGITWVELAVNFLLLSQRSIPINIRENGISNYKNNEDHEGFDVKAYSFTSMVNSFRDSLEHLQYLAQTPILPTMSPTKVKSICLLGCGHLKQGIPCRPRMLKQKETLDVLTNFPKPDETGQPQSFWNHPMIPGADPVISPSIATPADNTLAARNRRYHQRRREIKRGRTE